MEKVQESKHWGEEKAAGALHCLRALVGDCIRHIVRLALMRHRSTEGLRGRLPNLL